MDRIWQWAWDRYAARYLWAIWVIMVAPILLTFVAWSALFVAFENSTHYVEAAAVTSVAVIVVASAVLLPGSGRFRRTQQWAAGRDIDRATALKDTYTWARAVGVRALWLQLVWGGVLFAVVGEIAGASGLRVVESAVAGAILGVSTALVGRHTFVEGAMRPARAALDGGTGIGDVLPRSQPTSLPG
jgi:hypothetical protein